MVGCGVGHGVDGRFIQYQYSGAENFHVYHTHRQPFQRLKKSDAPAGATSSDKKITLRTTNNQQPHLSIDCATASELNRQQPAW